MKFIDKPDQIDITQRKGSSKHKNKPVKKKILHTLMNMVKTKKCVIFSEITYSVRFLLIKDTT